MNLAEHIKDLENTRAARVARLEELTSKSVDAGRSFEQAEVDEFDDIQAEIKQIDEDLVRYNALLKLQAATAAPVSEPVRKTASGTVPVHPRQAPAVITNKEPEEKFVGQNFTRFVIAKAVGKMQDRSPVAVAQERWGKTHPSIIEVVKADVAGHGSSSGEAGAELVHYDRWLGDFIEYLYSMTVYNQLPLREVPANINIAGQDGAATGYWVGESKAIPVSKADFSDVNLTPLKVAALSVISKELLRDSSPSAEMLIRDALVQAISQRIDTTFLSTSAAVSGVSPAGILNGVTINDSAGTDDSALINDIKELVKTFVDQKNSTGLYWVMNPSLAMSISLLRNALDQYTFPAISTEGGMLHGIPAVTGHNVDANHLILLKPTDIYRIGMGNIEISVSEHASIEMNDAPAQDTDTPTAATGKVVNMFQTESMAIKCVQSMNFQKRRTSAVRYIGDADYGGSVST
jgi:HK97 family phage major capsid protein